jgi:hypothetical protein
MIRVEGRCGGPLPADIHAVHPVMLESSALNPCNRVRGCRGAEQPLAPCRTIPICEQRIEFSRTLHHSQNRVLRGVQAPRPPTRSIRPGRHVDITARFIRACASRSSRRCRLFGRGYDDFAAEGRACGTSGAINRRSSKAVCQRSELQYSAPYFVEGGISCLRA